MRKKQDVKSNGQQYWLWVTGPDYYLDEDGAERRSLDPEFVEEKEDDDDDEIEGGWWTCHRDTRRGDLVYLWRTSPKSDIGYLIRAESDAYSILDDDFAAKKKWDYGCEYDPLFKFKTPLNIKDIRNDPYMDEWKPLNGRFQGKVFRIEERFWHQLNKLIIQKNPEYKKFLDKVSSIPIEPISSEEKLEAYLSENLHILKPFGYNLKLQGRQVICEGTRSRIDLLCFDSKLKQYVVIELKNVKANRDVIGQILDYTGFIEAKLSPENKVLGLVISRGFDTKFQSAIKQVDSIKQLNIEQIGLD